MMKNPWTAKNPWMSAWLSGANTLANMARGHAMRATRRQMSASQSSTTQQARRAAEFWAGVWSGSAVRLAPVKTTRRKTR